MKNFTTKIKVFAFFLIFFIFSCSEKNSVTSSMTSPELGGASHTEVYANTNELEDISKTKDALNWKMARFLAYDELLSLEPENGWVGASLSATPIVIYSSTSEPKYYEFRVIKNKEEIGAITANVYPKGGAIAYTLNFVRNYTKATTKGVNGKVIDNGYPSVAFGVIGKSGNKVSALINTKGERIKSSEPADIIEMVEVYGTEEITEQTGLSKEELVALIEERRNILTELETDFRLMNEALPNVENLTDEEIKDMLTPSKGRRTIHRKIPAYQNIEYLTFYYEPCGPSALGWVYCGLFGTRYKGMNMIFINPTNHTEGLHHNDFNNGLIDDLIRAMGTKNNGITLPHNLGKGLSAVTSGRYTTGWVLWPGRTFNHMKRSDLPLISLRTGRWNNGKKDWEWHYRVIYGTIEDRKEHRFLWWRWSTSHNRRIYMHDNGTDTPNGAYSFTEAANNRDFAHFPVKRR